MYGIIEKFFWTKNFQRIIMMLLYIYFILFLVYTYGIGLLLLYNEKWEHFPEKCHCLDGDDDDDDYTDIYYRKKSSFSSFKPYNS